MLSGHLLMFHLLLISSCSVVIRRKKILCMFFFSVYRRKTSSTDCLSVCPSVAGSTGCFKTISPSAVHVQYLSKTIDGRAIDLKHPIYDSLRVSVLDLQLMPPMFALESKFIMSKVARRAVEGAL